MELPDAAAVSHPHPKTAPRILPLMIRVAPAYGAALRAQPLDGRIRQRLAVPLRGVQSSADPRRQYRLADPVSGPKCLQRRGKMFQQQGADVVEDTAGIGDRHGFRGAECELAACRIDHERQFPGGVADDGHCLRVSGRRGLGNPLAQLRNSRAIALQPREYMGAEIQILGQRQALPDDVIQRSPRRPAVAHAREQIQAPACHPIGGTLVAEQFAPAAASGDGALALAVANGAGARDDADAVAAEQGAGPTANHVVAAQVLTGRQAAARQIAQGTDQGGVLAVGGQTEERKIHLLGADGRLGQNGVDAVEEQCAERIQADGQIVGARRQVRGSDRTLGVDQHQGCLGAASVDSQIQVGGALHSVWMVTPRTTRLTVPELLGWSGVLPTDSDR